MALKIYKDGTPFTGVIGRTTEEVVACLAGATSPARGCTQCDFLRVG